MFEEPWPVRHGYDPLVAGLSASSLKTFATCRHQFWLKYKLGLRLSMTSAEAPIDLCSPTLRTQFGTMFHAILEARSVLPKPAKADDAGLTKWVRECRDWAMENVGLRQELPYWPDAWNNVNMAEAVAYHYFDVYHEEDAKKEYLGWEQRFSFDYSHPKLLATKVRLKGYLDSVHVRPSTRLKGRNIGEYWVDDTKTRVQMDPLEHRYIYADPQLAIYLIALRMNYPEKECGGVCFDKVFRSKIVWKKGESLEEYCARYKEYYRNRLAERNRKETFDRHQIIYTPKMMEEIESRYLVPLLNQFLLWKRETWSLDDPWASKFHFANPMGLKSMYGWNEYAPLLGEGAAELYSPQTYAPSTAEEVEEELE